MGRFASSVTDQYHPYAMPQEHGAHHQTRSFQLATSAGHGFDIRFAEPQSFSARFHHDVMLAEATTLAELEARRAARPDSIEVHIDAAMRGLGTGACGPHPLAPYLVAPGRYAWTWSITAR